ncbi:MAG: alpha/beta hydrolase [Desulfobacteraceae bacterium]|nr:alpha/beta hydrolase [Desulfobacteraceae bacterium]MBC2718765.1 alpha/beta hydrolase [Desulfobacteraceae bacterium]
MLKDGKVNLLIKFILSVFLLYIGYCCFFSLLQRQIIFPCFQLPEFSSTEDKIYGLEKIWLNTSSGKVEAWFMPPASGHDKGACPAVIFAHGNAEVIDFWLWEFKNFTNLGVGVMLVEYPGYGRSEGSPSKKSINEAFLSAYDILVARKDVDSERIIIFGRSIGGGAACALAAKRPSAALILKSTFISIRLMASKFFVPGFLVKDPFDNLTLVKSYSKPVLVIHGKYDEIIPYSHGVALYEAAKNGKMITYDCGHNDCPPNWKVFWRDIELFLKNAEII